MPCLSFYYYKVNPNCLSQNLNSSPILLDHPHLFFTAITAVVTEDKFFIFFQIISVGRLFVQPTLTSNSVTVVFRLIQNLMWPFSYITKSHEQEGIFSIKINMLQLFYWRLFSLFSEIYATCQEMFPVSFFIFMGIEGVFVTTLYFFFFFKLKLIL